MTRTYAILDVTADTFREIQTKLEAAGYQHAFTEGADGQLVIDLHGVAIRDEDADADEAHAIGEPLARPGEHGKPERPS